MAGNLKSCAVGCDYTLSSTSACDNNELAVCRLNVKPICAVMESPSSRGLHLVCLHLMLSANSGDPVERTFDAVELRGLMPNSRNASPFPA